MLFCIGFLGENAASLPDPLHAFNLYRRHPDFDVLYLNWTMGQLQEGDILVVRYHTHFCSAVHAPFPPLCTRGTSRNQRAAIPSEGPLGGRAHHVPVWRSALKLMVADPSHSWYGVCVRQKFYSNITWEAESRSYDLVAVGVPRRGQLFSVSA